MNQDKDRGRTYLPIEVKVERYDHVSMLQNMAEGFLSLKKTLNTTDLQAKP
jgi:hypothetical protein